MIDIKVKQLETWLEKAKKDAGSDEMYKLFSYTEKINEKNPLEIFEGAQEFHQNRFFWTDTDRKLTILGVGNVVTLKAKKDRYHDTEKLWKQLLKHALIENPYQEIPATGVVAFGGMDFDPLKPKTELWQKFNLSQFYIPEIMLTIYHSQCYLTVNVLLHQNDVVEEVVSELQKKQVKFLSGKTLKPQNIIIEKSEEIETERWMKTVRLAMEEMRLKKAEKIVLARELQLYFKDRVTITPVLEKLLETQKDSYVFAYESEGDCFIGATPERLVKVQKNELLSTCLAGTAPRGKTKAEDEQIGRELLQDKKNREEHQFVVKMIKEALLKTCTDVEMPEEPVLRPLKNLQHLYTPVTGTLKAEYSIFDVVKNLHPTPALGGTPTDVSLAFIREHEALDRGWYGAPIGWVDSNDNGEFAVAIRSALVQGNKASLFAGCGVLADSDPDKEYEETRIKMLPMLNVLGGKRE